MPDKKVTGQIFLLPRNCTEVLALAPTLLIMVKVLAGC